MPSNIDVLTKLQEGPADIETIKETLATAKEIVDDEMQKEETLGSNAIDMASFYDSLPRKVKRKLNPQSSFSNRFKASINKRK